MLLLVAVLMTACDSSSKKSASDVLREFRQQQSGQVQQGGQMQQQAQGGQMYRCPMCNGTGIFEYMPGDVMAPRERCTGCNGTGAVDAATAQSIMEMQQRVNSTFGGGNSGGGYGGGGGNYGGGGNSGRNQCVNCYGNGKCPMCAGRGERRYEGMYGQPGGIMDCPTCHGSGRCQMCYGRGYN